MIPLWICSSQTGRVALASFVVVFLVFSSAPLVEAMGLSPISLVISSSSNQKCCGSYGYKPMKYSKGEAFDDGTPLSFYRQQVAKMYGGGGGGGSGGGYKPAVPSYKQLIKESFGYQSMLMGGGFMPSNGGFGPAGKSTSKKWRGYAKFLLNMKSGGYGEAGDKLTNIMVVPSGATDEYKDSYITMIADTFKQQQKY